MDICWHGRSCPWAGVEVWGCEDAAKETGKVLKAGYCSGAQWGVWFVAGAPLGMILSCSPKALALMWNLGVGLAYHSSSDGAWADWGTEVAHFSGFIGFVVHCGWCRGAVFR
ncbi:hypothetical protein U1Q18_044545 [Sarracenia purpurea var. burkii]